MNIVNLTSAGSALASQANAVQKCESRCSGHKRHRSAARAIVLTVFSTLLATACSNDEIPLNASLRITPNSHSTTVTEQRDSNDQCLFFTDNYVDIPVLLQLNTADGSPIGDAQISVYADFAANTFPGFPVLSLYDDLNGNGVVDSPIELISGRDDDIARVKTDEWSGSRALLLRVNLSCAFSGEIFAFADGVNDRAAVAVIAGGFDVEGTTDEDVPVENASLPITLEQPGS